MLKRIFSLLLLMGLAATAPARAAEPLATLSIADATVVEGNASFRELLFPVTLSRAQTFDVSASFKTRDITATAGTDYAPQSAGQIVIKAGQTRANILIRVLGNKIEERDESFLVQLGAPKRCAISDSDGIGTIKDDDYAGQITITDISVNELNSGQKVAKLEVKFSQAPLHDIEVRYATKDGTAKAGLDYVATQGTLLFRPGRLILSVSVPIVGETLVESDENFSVNLLVTGFAVQKPRGVVTIVNDDSPPAPSGPGKIAFSSSRDGFRNTEFNIWIMNADGTNQTQLTQGKGSDLNSEPNLSRDGKRIVFTSLRDGHAEIYVMNADGTGQTRLTFSGNGGAAAQPCFSPDGSKIAFLSLSEFSIRRIAIMNADGTGGKTLTTSFTDGSPDFSPDGKKIAFNKLGDENDEIYLMNVDGSGQVRLTNNSLGADTGPAFSPDGTRIAFGSLGVMRRADDDDDRYEIYAMNVDGSGQTRLTFPPGTGLTNSDKYDPCFSPDGGKIAYRLRYSAEADIYVVNADGSGQLRLTTMGYTESPSWSIGSVPAPPPAQSAQSAPSAGNS